jgi:hypothetical protein
MQNYEKYNHGWLPLPLRWGLLEVCQGKEFIGAEGEGDEASLTQPWMAAITAF